MNVEFLNIKVAVYILTTVLKSVKFLL